jgi:catechol 2,3-dioxygenase
MLPGDISLGPVHLTVVDLDRAIDFYQTTLGFSPVDRVQETATLSATGRAPAHLILTGKPGARRGRTAGLYHFAILLPSRGDLARMLRHLIERRAPLEGASDHAVSEALYLHDPEGNGIEIYRDRPRGQWSVRGGELAMGTQPLDLEDLLAEDARPWEGMPAATRIGHIHLHVSDLARAERFYAGVLGFEVMVRSYPRALFVAAGGYHHHIGMNTWAGEGIPPMDPEGAGLRYFTVTVPDEDARRSARDRLRAAGVSLREVREGPVAGWLARDPDGIGVLLAS